VAALQVFPKRESQGKPQYLVGVGWEDVGEASVIVVVRKNTTHKESSREKFHIQEQGLMIGSSCQAGRGKMAQH
jgi:hypothetical protein